MVNLLKIVFPGLIRQILFKIMNVADDILVE